MVVGLCASAAFALTPMGPPTATLKQGQYSVGLDYSNSRMDFIANGDKIKNVNANALYTKLGYGASDNCEMFLNLGIANADFKLEGGRFVGDTGFAIGFGTKGTFYEDADLKLGGLFQVNWADLGGTAKVPGREAVDLDIREIQIAAGPNYRLMEGVSIYGGPFFHFLHGDWNGGAVTGSSDIHEAHSFGGYIGTQIDVRENLAFNIEYLHTGAADMLGMGLTYRF